MPSINPHCLNMGSTPLTGLSTTCLHFNSLSHIPALRETSLTGETQPSLSKPQPEGGDTALSSGSPSLRGRSPTLRESQSEGGDTALHQ